MKSWHVLALVLILSSSLLCSCLSYRPTWKEIESRGSYAESWPKIKAALSDRFHIETIKDDTGFVIRSSSMSHWAASEILPRMW